MVVLPLLVRRVGAGSIDSLSDERGVESSEGWLIRVLGLVVPLYTLSLVTLTTRSEGNYWNHIMITSTQDTQAGLTH